MKKIHFDNGDLSAREHQMVSCLLHMEQQMLMVSCLLHMEQQMLTQAKSSNKKHASMSGNLTSDEEDEVAQSTLDVMNAHFPDLNFRFAT